MRDAPLLADLAQQLVDLVAGLFLHEQAHPEWLPHEKGFEHRQVFVAAQLRPLGVHVQLHVLPQAFVVVLDLQVADLLECLEREVTHLL